MKKLSIFFVLALAFGCKSPTENLRLNVEPTLMNYLAIVDIKDMTTNEPASGDFQITFSGEDAAYIYSTDGTKKFKVADGKMQIALHPDREPQSATDTVKFNIEIGSAKYIPTTVEVFITKDQFTQNVRAQMMNIANPPAGMSITKKTLQLSGGALTGASATIKAKTTDDSVYYDDGQTTVVLPEGTTFYYYALVEAEGTRKVPVWEEKTHTETVNGEVRQTTTSVVGYYEDQKYKYWTRQKKQYQGGSIQLYGLFYTTSVPYKVTFDEPYKSDYNDKIISLYNNTSTAMGDLLYESAVKKRLYDLRFVGKITENGVERSIDLSPDSASKWFVSYVLDPTTINPVTNLPIAEGDSIEVSIDLENGITRRTDIKKINNQLRIETANLDAGYYYQGQYSYPFNYQFNNTYSKDEIPDPENIEAYLSTNVFSLYVVPWYDNISYKGKIVSATPVTPTGNISVYYWNKRVKNENIASFNVTKNVFQNLPSLGEKSTWDFKIICEKKEYVPDYLGEVKYDDGWFYAQVEKGTWSTRGLTLGREYNFSGMGYSPSGKLVKVKRNYKVNTFNKIIEWLDGGGKNLCDEF